MTRTTACLPLLSELGIFQSFEGVFPRGPNLEYKSQKQARGLSLSSETLSEAPLPLFVLIGCNTFQMEIFKISMSSGLFCHIIRSRSRLMYFYIILKPKPENDNLKNTKMSKL